MINFNMGATLYILLNDLPGSPLPRPLPKGEGGGGGVLKKLHGTLVLFFYDFVEKDQTDSVYFDM